MAHFIGKHLHAIDEKGRINLPARFRDGEVENFILTESIDFDPGCIFVYPKEEWDKTVPRLTELLKTRKDARRFVLRITSSATEAVPDRQGRIGIPQSLLKFAGLEKEALIVGALQKIEIWNPERFQAFISGPERPPEELAEGILY